MLRSRLNQAPCSVLHRGRMKGCWRAKALKQSEKAWIKDTRVSFTLYLEPFVALTYPSLHVSQHRPSPCLHLSCSSRPYSLAGYFNEHNLTKIKYSRGYQEELNENVNSKSSHDTFCMLWKEMLKCHSEDCAATTTKKALLSYAARLCGVWKFSLWFHRLPPDVMGSLHGQKTRSWSKLQTLNCL